MSFNVKINELSKYASYTYKFKLFMVPLDDFNAVINNPDGVGVFDIHTKEKIFKRKVVLAESGTTSIGIQGVTITSKPANNHSYTTTVRMQLVQAKGFSFFDSIIKAADLCFYSEINPLNASSMFLEISFVGMTEYGEERNNIFTVTYPVTVTNISVSVNDTGAVYDVTMNAFDYATKQDSFSLTPAHITIENVTNTSEFFNKLEKAINKAYQLDGGYSQHQYNTCSIIVEKQLQDLLLKPNDGSSPISDYMLGYDDNTGASFSISEGTAIPTVIESVLANVPEVQDLLLHDNIVGKVVYVEPMVLDGEYNHSLNSYAKIIKWYVRLKSAYVPRPPSEIDAARQLDLLASNGDLSKKYSYYYTGENTEVISVDMDYSNAFSLTLSSFESIMNNYASMPGVAPVKTENREDILNTINAQSKENQEAYSAKPAFRDKTGTEVFYVDDYEKMNIGLVKSIAPRYTKKAFTTKDDETGTTTQVSSPKRNEYNSLLKNVKELTYNMGLLSKISIEIRGDPHWLMPRNVYIKPDTTKSTVRDFNLFIVEVGLPYDETSGKMNVDNFMSRMYIAVDITSEFNDGKFTQKIVGNAINTIDRTEINKRIKEDTENNK